jgi:cytochrome c biogenesis protein CcdA
MLTITAHFPRGYAFVAGMITAVNPCGFALLPAYLGLYLNEESGSMPQTGHPIGRALIVSATVAFSFVILFGIFGLLVNSASTAITPFLPWIGTGVGVALILAGGFLAAGGEMPARFPLSAADRLGGLSRRGGVISFAAFGAGYGLASLGCALPIFLSVVATSLQARGLWSGVSQFVLFGLGMGSVLALLTIATASFGGGLLRGLRTSGKYFATLSAGLLWLAGAYVLFYWLTIGRLV